MKLKYDLTTESRAKKCDIVNRSSIDMVAKVFNKLDDEHQQMFKSSCFGHLLKLRPVHLNQLLHKLLTRVAKYEKEDVVWFLIGDKKLRFGLKEFTLVSGLKVGDLEAIDYGDNNKKRLCSPLVETYFQKEEKSTKGKGNLVIKRKDLLEVFNGPIVDETHRYKLGLLVVLAYVLMGREDNTHLELWWFHMVEDLDTFNKFPWGNLSYRTTIHLFLRDITHLFENPVVQYSLTGFPHAFMVWALEAIPHLSNSFDVVKCESLPRAVKWNVKRRVSSGISEGILQLENLEVVSKLVPRETEMCEPYYKTLMEYQGYCSDDGDDDDTEPMEENPPKQESCEDIVVLKERLDILEKLVAKLQGKVKSLEANSVCQQCKRSINGADELVGSHKKKEKDCEDEEALDTTVMEDHSNVVSVKMEDDMTAMEVEEKECEDEKKECEDEEVLDTTAMEDHTNVASVKMEDDMNAMEVNKTHEVIDVDKLVEEIAVYGSCFSRKVNRIEIKPCINVKRRKLNVDVYDPYREADPELMERYKKWLDDNRDGSELVRLVDDEVQISVLKLVSHHGEMPSHILNSALCEVRRRSDLYPELFQQDACILDSNFAKYVKRAFDEHLINGRKVQVKVGRKRAMIEEEIILSDKVSKTFGNYVSGIIPNGSKPWFMCRYLYFPVIDASHWFSVRIDMKEGKISVYDSLSCHVKKEVLDRWLVPLQVVVPFVMKKFVRDDVDWCLENEFTVEKLKGLPQQTNGIDCGIFALKWIEFLTGRQDVQSLKVDYMPKWREKLVAELLASQFDP